MTEVWEKTHRKKDGSFTTPRAEEIWNNANAKVVEEQTQRSQQLSPGGTMSVELSTPEIDRIFEQVAPKASRGDKPIGLGSIQKVPVASSLAPPRRRHEDDERAQLRAEIAELKRVAQKERAANDRIFALMAESNPQIAAILEEKRRQEEAEAAAGAEAQQRASTSRTAEDHDPVEDIDFS